MGFNSFRFGGFNYGRVNYFLTGRSGGRKTTLLRLILKEESPDTGKITLDGEIFQRCPLKTTPSS